MQIFIGSDIKVDVIAGEDVATQFEIIIIYKSYEIIRS